jgi:hypothetical protein
MKTKNAPSEISETDILLKTRVELGVFSEYIEATYIGEIKSVMISYSQSTSLTTLLNEL